MTDDAWQACATREAARDIGQWLEARGRPHQPIAALRASDLECLATAAIGRFVVLASERIREERPEESQNLRQLLAFPGCAPSAGGRIAASATPTISASTAIPATASARCAASMPDRCSHKGRAA